MTGVLYTRYVTLFKVFMTHESQYELLALVLEQCNGLKKGHVIVYVNNRQKMLIYVNNMLIYVNIKKKN